MPNSLLRQDASCPVETQKGLDLVSHLCMVTSEELHLPHGASMEKGEDVQAHGAVGGKEQRGGK